MFYKSWLTWMMLIYLLCSVIAKPAISNLPYYVPDNVKSIIVCITTMCALGITYMISKMGDKEASDKIRKYYLAVTGITLLIDILIVYSNSMLLRYIIDEVHDKMMGSVFGVMFMDARRKEAAKLNTDIGGMWRRMEFPKCVAITLGGLIALYVYQVNVGLSIQNALYLKLFGGTCLDVAIVRVVLKKEDA